MTQPDCSPSAERNKQPIADVLRQLLPAKGNALEIASGTGQHVVWFAQQLPGWVWQPTEMQRGALYNIEVRVTQADLANVLDPVQLNVLIQPWLPTAEMGSEPTNRTHPNFDLIFCANMLHIAPWQACAALMHGSARYLALGGVLVTYGPYFENDVTPALGNVEFDQSLRVQDATWGIRQREEVQQQAQQAGLRLYGCHAMPSNNLLLVWGR
jgi:hypothetical protein